jgi:hypothetical protein
VRYPAFEQIDQTLVQYRKRLSGADSDIRELIAAVDFHVRVAYTLAIAASRLTGDTVLRAAPMPGFGTMLAAISAKSVSSAASSSADLASHAMELARSVRSEVESFKVPKRYASFKSMRDQLSHGHPLPADRDVVAATLTNLSALEEALTKNLRMSLKEVMSTEEAGKTLLYRGASLSWR